MPRRSGRPPSLSASEVLTLGFSPSGPDGVARGFFRFAKVHLREYLPNLLSYCQLNRRIRCLKPEIRALQRDLAETLAEPQEVYHLLDTASSRP
jgi:hypothetical protein